MIEQRQAVIVGGGVSGLETARRLTDAGIDAHVLEARDRVGGRLLSIEVGTRRLDLGATWFWGNEPRIHALTEQAELGRFDQYLAGDMMFQAPDNPTQRIEGNQLDVPSNRLTMGMQSVAESILAQLPPNRVEVSTTVTEISANEDRLAVRTITGSEFAAHHVVLALPPALAISSIAFGDGLEPQMRAVAEATPVWMGATVKVVAVYDEPFWRNAGLAGAAFSYRGPLREIHDMSGPGGDPAALFGFCGPRPGRPAPSRHEVVEQLVDLFGPRAGEPTELHIHDWRDEQFTSPSNVESLVNFQTFGHPLYQSPSFGGRLHWASTETSVEAPGHIEGALAAAARTAEHIIEDLSRKANI